MGWVQCKLSVCEFESGAEEKRVFTEEGEGVMTERWNKNSPRSIIHGIHQARVGSESAGGEGECHDDDAMPHG